MACLIGQTLSRTVNYSDATHYTYDSAGNRLSKTEFPYSSSDPGDITTTTFSYQYDGDRLIGYNKGSTAYTVEYDTVGNPVKFTANGSQYVMEWQGRQLTGMGTVISGDSWNKYVSFTYNADGIRTSKYYFNVKHEYMLNGSQIIGETWTDEEGDEYMLIYLYDENGSPIGMKYRTQYYAEGVFDCYFFEKNLQGDIVAVYNDEGAMIGAYAYDAWGNVKVTYGSNNYIVTRLNPFRYRGYYYDVETGFYYLQSRYYNPSWGRFLNMDDSGVITATPMGLTDKNLYAYCDNNPVMRMDGNGDFWETVFDVVSLGASIVEVCINPADPWAWAGLAGDAVDLIPFVTGVGEVTRAVNIGRKTLNAVDAIGDTVDNAIDTARAVDNTIDTYTNLRKINKGTGKEVHHIVEKRFAKKLQLNEQDMLSVALDPTTHRKFTNAWRTKLPYGKTHSIDEIWKAAQEIYHDYPNLLNAARKTLGR